MDISKISELNSVYNLAKTHELNSYIDKHDFLNLIEKDENRFFRIDSEVDIVARIKESILFIYGNLRLYRDLLEEGEKSYDNVFKILRIENYLKTGEF